MTRTRVRRRRLTLLACGAAFLVALGGPVAQALGPSSPPSGARPGHGHVVRPGESLWTIAVGLGGDRDPREIVVAIAEANRIDAGTIVPGQMLWIPPSA